MSNQFGNYWAINLKTTLNYLDSADDTSMAKQVENLLPFKRKLLDAKSVNR